MVMSGYFRQRVFGHAVSCKQWNPEESMGYDYR